MSEKDHLSKKQRSDLMSRVKTEGTDIEQELLECVRPLWKNHRYRKNYKKLPGKPDVVFTKQKVAVFADGDFWHGKDFEEWKDDIPEFWQRKIQSNIERDERQSAKLEEMGYTVLRFYGSELKKHKERIIRTIKSALYK